jgi:hypothetical protein
MSLFRRLVDLFYHSRHKRIGMILVCFAVVSMAAAAVFAFRPLKPASASPARCAGPMTVIAYLTEVTVLEKILTHLGLTTRPLPLSPAGHPEQVELCETWHRPRSTVPSCRGGRARGGGIRGPPPEEADDQPEFDQGTANDDRTADQEMDWA